VFLSLVGQTETLFIEDVDAVLERTLESSGYYFDGYVWGWSGADEQLTLSETAKVF